MRRISWTWVPLASILLAVVANGSWMLFHGVDGATSTPATVDVVASERDYATAAELADASDRVVDGTVVAIETGRPLTDAADPTVGVRTQLVSIEVIRMVKGDAVETVVIEQEATLLDGTPITVNGVAPVAVGDDGRFYLVDGDGEEFPYAALTTIDGFVPSG
jgi:hypothetical protein